MLDTTYSISIAKSNTKDANDKTEFITLEGQRFSDLGQIICTRTWSPHIWRHNYRKNANWQQANFIALDFDSGFPLTDAITICENQSLTFQIGTTKSHQLEKVSPSGKVTPPMDRYRLVIATNGPIADAETYRNTFDYFRVLFSYAIDESCSDLGRYFFPCKEIHSFGEGKLQPWLPISEADKKRKADYIARREQYYAENKGSGIIPSRILAMLNDDDPPVGTRHKNVYIIGAELSKLGFDENEIMELILDSALIAIGEDDVRYAVRNGIRGARNKRGDFGEWDI